MYARVTAVSNAVLYRRNLPRVDLKVLSAKEKKGNDVR